MNSKTLLALTNGVGIHFFILQNSTISGVLDLCFGDEFRKMFSLYMDIY